MKNPSKKEIKAAIEKLKQKQAGSSGAEPLVGKLSGKKSTQRIRKHGI